MAYGVQVGLEKFRAHSRSGKIDVTGKLLIRIKKQPLLIVCFIIWF